VKALIVVERHQNIAGIEKDELWWGLHWGGFSPSLRESILRTPVLLETIDDHA
jgi:hypothetical protein